MATTDPFAEIGGGMQLENGDWVPLDHPLAIARKQALASGASGGAPTSGAAGATGATSPLAPATLSGQAAGAAGVSGTPLAAPTGATSNQGVQDVARNSYLAMATQPRVPTRQDPEIRVPADAFAANVERQARNQVADVAERRGPYATGAVQGQARMARERAGIASGEFEASLIRSELEARRNEIQQALQGLTGFISEDQRQALQRELARLSAQLEQARLGQQASQFSDTLGFNVAMSEADLNDRALRLLLGGV